MNGQDKPKSVFDLGYFTSQEAAQGALDCARFGEPPVLHLPSHDDVRRVRKRLHHIFRSGEVTDADILTAYQELAFSASSSDIVCGVVAGGHRCGGLMDIEVSVFGAYYQCRVTSSHRFPV
jgi:hypothetical protein